VIFTIGFKKFSNFIFPKSVSSENAVQPEYCGKNISKFIAHSALKETREQQHTSHRKINYHHRRAKNKPPTKIFHTLLIKVHSFFKSLINFIDLYL